MGFTVEDTVLEGEVLPVGQGEGSGNNDKWRDSADESSASES